MAVVCDPGAIDAHRALIQRRGRVHILEDPTQIPALADDADLELVIVVGKDTPSAVTLYAHCDHFKRKGLPVVFGNQRNLFFAPPTWQSMHMAGMFYRASQYFRDFGQGGSYAEFGVFDGRSFTLAFHALRNVCARFYAFDSFEGIVGSQEEEQEIYTEGLYYANLETLRHNMRVAGVDSSRTHAIKGAFQDTLKAGPSRYGIESVSVCHIDSDIYEAAYLALNFIEPALQDGALLLFDEYNAFGADPNRGERRALTQWLRENPSVSVEHYRNYTAIASAFIFRRT